MSTNLVRRNATYYVRVATPKALQELRRSLSGSFGSREVLRSLRTKDAARARALQPEAMTHIYRHFELEEASLRRAGASLLTVPSDQDLQMAAFEFRRRELELDEQERLRRPSRDVVEAKVAEVRSKLVANPQWTLLQQLGESGYLEAQRMGEVQETEAERRHHLGQALRQGLSHNEFHLVDWAIEDAAFRHRWRIEKGDIAYREFGRHLLKTWLRTLESSNARDRGDYDGADADVVVPINSKRGSAPHVRVSKCESLRDFFESYLKERHPDLGSSGLKDRRATVRQFIECSGDKPAAEYRKADMAAYKKLLAQLPSRVEKLYPGLPLAKAVERNRQDGHPTLMSNSVRNKLSVLSAFGDWLEDNIDGVDAGNFKTTLPRKNDVRRMEPFSASQIAAILNAKAFTGCQSEKNQQEVGAHRIRDWRLWLPLMLAFSGARLNEIVQLRVDDLEQVGGIWVFNITGEGEGQSLKTASSRRQLPIHPRLIELGLLDFHAAAREAGERDLFHQVPCDRDGRHSTQAGKWFRKFLVRIGVKGEQLGGSHRWRHTLADALRRGGVVDFDVGRLLGHDVNVAKMTGHYGREVDLSLQGKFELISKADYPSVDFTLLDQR